ncbi:hypothetical protein AB0O90_16220 [Microbacterium testaceum]|uniref:hypothetical protein n=1 Tax=Microbacterium testaceum TaxID=2033 RepID=UPI003423407B
MLTGSQTVMGVAIIMALRFHWWSAASLAAIFAVQFFVTDTGGRYVLSGVQIAIAVVALIVHRRSVLPTLAAPFRRRFVPEVLPSTAQGSSGESTMTGPQRTSV